MKRILVLTAALSFLAAVFLITAPAPEVSAADSGNMATSAVDMTAAKKIFEETCSKCHSLDRPLGKKKDQAGWESTVSRMSMYYEKRLGQAIPQEDQAAIVQYLLSVAGK